MEGEIPCQVALDYLEQGEVKPVSECLPPGSASLYISARKIRALFEDKPHGVTLEMMFLCPCSRCEQDGGSVDDRSPHYNKLREQELRGDYALIYALLIYIRRPGLIRKFQKHELKLQGTMYLRESDFEVLYPENILRLDMVRRKVVEKQYSFLVRALKPLSDITAISHKELLPINEDPEPKGEGTFAEVRCFEFQDDEYRSREFGEVGIPIQHRIIRLISVAYQKIRSQDLQAGYGKIRSERVEQLANAFERRGSSAPHGCARCLLAWEPFLHPDGRSRAIPSRLSQRRRR